MCPGPPEPLGAPLSAAERAMLDFLLEPALPGARELREQARWAMVRRRCACGCPTIELAVDAARAPRAADARGPVHAKARIPGPVPDPYHVYLYVADGWLAELELVALSTRAHHAFPPTGELEPAVGPAVSFGPEGG
jgi:hypothetical protein